MKLKKKNEHNNEIALRKMEDENNLKIIKSNNINKEEIDLLNLEDLKNNEKTEIKIKEINLEKQKSNN